MNKDFTATCFDSPLDITTQTTVVAVIFAAMIYCLALI